MSENNNAVSDLSSFWGVYGKYSVEEDRWITYEEYPSQWFESFVEQDLGKVTVSGRKSQKNELLRELAEQAADLGANLVLQAELTSEDPTGISDFFSSCLHEDSDEPLYISGRAVKTVSDEILYLYNGFFTRPGEFYGSELLVTRQDPIKVGSAEVSLGGSL